MLCPQCGGEFKVVEVEERKTGRKGFVLECSVCEFFNFDYTRWTKTNPVREDR